MALEVWGLFFLDICSEVKFNTSFLRATKFYVLRPNFLAIEIGVQIELQGEEVSLERTTCYTMTNISFICLLLFLLLFLCIFHLQCIAKNNF